jgi:hypothetical protein
MKKISIIILGLGIALSMSNCKAMARTAAKYWTKKQIKAFVKNCEEKAGKFVGEDKANHFCDCAVDQVAEKYQEYESVEDIKILEVLKIANDCR